MMLILSYFLKPVKIYVLITFIYAVFSLSKKKINNKLLILILGLSLCTEILHSYLIYKRISLGFSSNISVLCTHTLWFLLLTSNFKRKSAGIVSALFFLFGIINFFFLEGLYIFNFNTFITGAILYIVIFVYESFKNLKDENLDFFLSNNYILLFAPVLYFLGLSFIFGFKDLKLATTIIFGHTNLYTFIGILVNFFYYSLINIYIYRDKKSEK